MTATDVTQLRLSDGVQRRFVDPVQPFGNARINTARMKHAFHCRHLLATLRGRPAWHDGLLIPTQPARDLCQRLGFALERHQLIKSTHQDLPRTDVGMG